MKRILSVIMCAVLAVSMFAIFPATRARAEASYSFDGDTGTLTISGTGAASRASVLSAIGNDKSKVKAVIIEYGITEIGNELCRDFKNLTAVTMPNSVLKIGEYAFSYCKKLSDCTIGSGITEIGKYAFECCYLLPSITIPDSVKTIGDHAFVYCKGASSLSIGSNVTKIDARAFESCYGLTSVTIPDNVQTLGNFAITYCKQLSDITIGNGITEIVEGTFENCYALSSVTIKNKNCTLASNCNIKGKSTKHCKIYAYSTCTSAKSYCDVTGNYCDFVAIDRTITCSVAEADTGTLTADKAIANIGEKVTFTATPSADYVFDKITINGSDVTESSYEYTVPAADVTAVATFKPVTYTVSCSEVTNGTLTADKTAAAKDEKVTFTATPAAGYKLKNITVTPTAGTASESTTSPYEYTMPEADVTATATFEPISYNVNITAPTNGAVTSDKNTAYYGDKVKFTATPDAGYKLVSITVTPEGGEDIVMTTSPYEYTMTAANVSATASFETINYDVTCASDLTGGTLAADKSTAVINEKVTFTATPATGYKLTKITITPEGGTAVEATTSPYEYTMPAANVTATATFELRYYQISATVSESGEINLSTSSARTGDVVTVEAVAAKNFILDSITAKCEGKTIAIADDGTFTMPSGDVIVEAAYSPLKFLTGESQKWKTDSSADAEFSTNGIYENFTGIQLDGTAVDTANYTVKKGSTIVTLKNAYLKTLKTGKHTLTVMYSDGSAIDTTFTISAKSAGPETGDKSSPVALAVVANLFGFAAMAAYYFFPGFRRKENEG